MGHVILLGDSIFDNERYVPGGPSVIDHFRQSLPEDDRATLLAVDGALTEHVALQLRRLPQDATHLVVSVGGNDALGYSGGILNEPARSFREVLSRMARIGDDFRQLYREMLQAVLRQGKPTIVCTIYDAVPGLSDAQRAGVALFNEVILREAVRHGLPIIDLRLVCNEASDYSSLSPIEPSAAGGAKIARAIDRAIAGAGDGKFGCRVFV